MSEVTAVEEEEMELEGKTDDTNEKQDDLFHLEDENGKKQLVEIDELKDIGENCHKTT